MNIRTTIITTMVFAVSMSFAGGFHLSGNWKSFGTATFIPQYIQDLTGYGDATAMVDQGGRLNISYSPARFASLNASYDLAFRVHDRDFDLSFMSMGGGEPYRVDDFKSPLFPDDDERGNLSIIGNLDRAFLRLSWKGDLYVGRQSIAWGAARMVNPTDVIVPFSYDAIDTEYRPGVDALRLRIPLGMMSELDMGYIAGKDFKTENSAFYARGSFYAYNTDFSLIAMNYRESLLFGFDMMRSIGGAGTWLELAYSQKEAVIGHQDETQDIFRLSVGADYSFSGKLYGSAEYHFNSAGRGFDGDYADILAKPAYQHGEIFLLGQHYIIPMASYTINPLLTASGAVYFNITDQSLLVLPSIEYNIAEDIYLACGGYFGIGKGLEAGEGPQPKMNSEFGSYPDLVYLAFRLYF